MSIAIPFLAFLLAGAFAAYHRLRLAVWAALTATAAGRLLAARRQRRPRRSSPPSLVALIAVPLLIPQFRKPLITTPLLSFYTQDPAAAVARPSASRWKPARSASKASCSPASRTGTSCSSQPKPAADARKNRPSSTARCEELCRMTDDWEITHVHADLPPELWDFIKKNKFFGMIIPKEYGGLGFSALAQPQGDPEARVDLHRASAPPSACPTRSARPNC